MMVRLEHPISLADGSRINAIILREPTVEDVQATNPEWLKLRLGEDPGDTFDDGMELFERLSGLPQIVFFEMDVADYVALCEVVAEQLFELRDRSAGG